MSACARDDRTAGPFLVLSIPKLNTCFITIAFPISPPRASISLTRCPLAKPPMAGLQDICPILSKFIVMTAVFKPIFATDKEASMPA